MILHMSFSPRFNLSKLLCGAFVLCFARSAFCDGAPDVKTFESEIQPLFENYCLRCHGVPKSEANIRFDNIDPNIVSGEDFDHWEDIREAFNTGAMPPENEAQPTEMERQKITRWLDAEFKKAKLYGVPDHRSRIRRLTRYELQYALEDLLHVSAAQEVNSLPEEATSIKTGLKNNSQLLMISGPHLESYLNAILSVIDKIKGVTAFKPYAAQLDIAGLETHPPQAFTRDGRKVKPPVSKVEKEGSVLVISPKGYIDLQIPTISRYKFETVFDARSQAGSEIQVEIGFTHSEIDPRQKTAILGILEIAPNSEFVRYQLDSFPEKLSDEMTRALDRPFFIRLSNRSNQKIYLNALNYRGNVNGDLRVALIGSDNQRPADDHEIRLKISKFLRKAFRAPPSDADVDRYWSIYTGHRQTEEQLDSLLSTYKEILCSPRFFYLGTSENDLSAQGRNFQLAERLASFLWCSVPDERLLDAADAGRLTEPEMLERQIKRMLLDKKSKRWVERFADQWLQTSKLFNVAVDKNYYPRFNISLKSLMRQETIEAVNDVFRNGAPAIDLLDANHVFVNQSLASFYEIKGVNGREFRKVPVSPQSHRGGLLTQATFLIGNSDGMNSHAILRGVWLSDIILNDPPPDPPKNVPPLDESIPGFEKMTLNQKLFAHRNNDACNSCHNKIDPFGIPFENYDASGAWRNKVLVVSKSSNPQPGTAKGRKRKRPALEKSYLSIDRQAVLPDSAAVDGIEELKEYLVSRRKRDFARGLTERILACALSRDIDFHDEELVEQLLSNFEANNYSVPLLIRTIVSCDEF